MFLGVLTIRYGGLVYLFIDRASFWRFFFLRIYAPFELNILNNHHRQSTYAFELTK